MADDPSNKLVQTKPFMQNMFFLIVYIISFILILNPNVELFGMGMFFVVNVLYGIMTGLSVTNMEQTKTQAQYIYTVILLIVLVMSIVASVLLAMTLFHVQKKFIANKTKMNFSNSTRTELTNTEIMFITLIVCSWVLKFYSSYTADNAFAIIYKVFNKLFNSKSTDYLRLIFPIAALGLGGAIYGQLERNGILVDMNSSTYCKPDDDFSIFKDHFIKAFWFLFAYVMIIVVRPFIEAYVFGHPPESWKYGPLCLLYGLFWILGWLVKSPLGIFVSLCGLLTISILMVSGWNFPTDSTL